MGIESKHHFILKNKKLGLLYVATSGPLSSLLCPPKPEGGGYIVFGVHGVILG